MIDKFVLALYFSNQASQLGLWLALYWQAAIIALLLDVYTTYNRWYRCPMRVKGPPELWQTWQEWSEWLPSPLALYWPGTVHESNAVHECSAVQCSAVQCSAVQWPGTVHESNGVRSERSVRPTHRPFRPVQRANSAVQCSAVQCSAVQCSAECQQHDGRSAMEFSSQGVSYAKRAEINNKLTLHTERLDNIVDNM
jgi:hypothetical protein